MIRRLGAVALLAVLLTGCQSNFNLATKQLDYTMTSTDKEVAMGRQLAHRVVAERPLLADDAVQQRVMGIGRRLAAVCGRQELVYSFAVLDDDEVNAFSLPGGYVYVNSGLVKRAADDDELAAVIAHEVGHIAARHAVKRYEGHLSSLAAQLAAVATRQPAAIHGLSTTLAATRLAYARQDELEADRLGVQYLKAAGFNPVGMLTFLQRLEQLHSDAPSHYLPAGMVRPQYALTHPFIPERLRAVKEALYDVADYLDYLNTAP